MVTTATVSRSVARHQPRKRAAAAVADQHDAAVTVRGDQDARSAAIMLVTTSGA